MFKNFLAALLCAMMLFCTAASVSAAELNAGDTAYVIGNYDLPVTEDPSAGGSKIMAYRGARVTVLEPYINGEDNTKENANFHKIRLADGTEGYILAYVLRKKTLEPVETYEEKAAANQTSDSDKYQHTINMGVLYDYIYGGSLAQSGKVSDARKFLPEEWKMHERPASLPLVGMAVIHVGDEGELNYVRASFLPGNTTQNYHEMRLAELKEIGYDPVVPQPKGSANTAFYCMSGSEFEVVAYNEQWVAVWSIGALDTSRGMGANCRASSGIQYASWKSGVYFIPRQYCYLLDINNQISNVPKIQGMGKATAALLVKTTPDSDDYVKSGVYKVNQSFQIVNATPQNGHYQIYYKKGLYYVDAKNVNVSLSNVKKPLINFIATVNTNGSGTALIKSGAGDGETVAEAKNGAAIDVLEKDAGNGYSKIWFNSKECYIKTESLTDFQETPSVSGLAQLGLPIGTIALDTPWGAYGQRTYSAEALAILKNENYDYDSYSTQQKLESMKGAVKELANREWVNVYNIEEFSFDRDADIPWSEWIETGKIYTVVHGGEVRYIVEFDEWNHSFAYYPGRGYSQQTKAKTQEMYVDTEKYSVLAYNINDNNYFKLRDIAKMLDGTIKSFDVEYDGETNSINMRSLFPYTAAGGELTPGDGAERTAQASTAFLTYDGMPVKAACYNIDGNNYFKLRDVTDALDCRVEWDSKNQLIKVYTSLPAYDDPNEPVG